MLNINEVIETNKMIREMNLDVRTITMVSACQTASVILLMKYVRIFTTRLQQKQRIL